MATKLGVILLLTATGFKRMRFADFLPIIEEQAKELFGEDANLSERTPLGKFIRLQAYQRAEDNELAENIYNSRFVDTSEGVALEQNVKRALITKKQWKKAVGEIVLNLAKSTTVPAGYIFGTQYGVKYKTLNDIKALDNGSYRVTVEALEYGIIGNAAVGDINVIVTPLTGIISVTNPEPFRNGQDEETRDQLQNRYYQSLGKLGNRRNESIEARVLDEVEGVRACIVIDNDGLEPDADGRPGKSFETIVLGGNASAIAQKIKEAKTGGIRAYGQEIVQVTDTQGRSHSIGFTYASSLKIYVKASIKKGANYPLDGDEQVKRQIVQFIGGIIGDEFYKGLGMNEDVVLARLEAQLFKVEGVVDVKVSISTDGFVYLEENVEIGFAQVAETDASKIEVKNLVT